jgi:hypothetical protein
MDSLFHNRPEFIIAFERLSLAFFYLAKFSPIYFVRLYYKPLNMSAASLLKVYDGVDTELAFTIAGPGATPDLAQVLAAGASANDLAITDLLSLTGGTSAPLAIDSGVGVALDLTGAVGVSLTATTADVAVASTAAGVSISADTVLTLSAGTAQPDGLVLAGAGLAPAAAAGANITVTHQISFKVGATTYWIPILSAAPSA